MKIILFESFHNIVSCSYQLKFRISVLVHIKISVIIFKFLATYHVSCCFQNISYRFSRIINQQSVHFIFTKLKFKNKINYMLQMNKITCSNSPNSVLTFSVDFYPLKLLFQFRILNHYTDC